MSAQAEALNNIVLQLRSLVGGDGYQQSARPEASRVKPPVRTAGVSKSLTALKTAVTRPSKPVEAAVPAGNRSSIPLEDSFT